MSLPSGISGRAAGGGFGGSDKGLKFGLADTFRLAWADEEMRGRLTFVMIVFAIYSLCIHVPVPIPGVNPATLEDLVKSNQLLGLLNMFGGRALQKISILALGLNPYITASIIIQIMNTAHPTWKQELKEGGEHARRQQNMRTRALSLVLCIAQGWGILNALRPAFAGVSIWSQVTTLVFWMAGAMFLLWLGEQLTEKGIGNGVSMLIFAGIVIALPDMLKLLWNGMFVQHTVEWYQALMFLGIFFATVTFVVFFSIAQRRIPIQHMRRQIGTKAVGGQTSYLPLSVNLVGVIPIIFAISLVYLPTQFAGFFPANTPMHDMLINIGEFFVPNFSNWKGAVAALVYTMLIFIFTYFYTAIQYNAEDIADNLKRAGNFIPGIRPGKHTKEFIDKVITRITIVGAIFLAIVSLTQYVVPLIIPIRGLSLLFGTSLLIMVSVALDTMRQIEANLLMKQYGG